MYNVRPRKNFMYKLDLGPEPAELTIKHLLQSLAQIEFSMLESRVVV